MLGEHSDKIAKATKMTFAHLDEHQGRGALIGETEFAIPDKEDEKVKLYIYMATPKFDLEAMNVSSPRHSILTFLTILLRL